PDVRPRQGRCDARQTRSCHFTRSPYWEASSSARASSGLVSLTAMSQLACGSPLTTSGLLLTVAFTSTTSPDTGANNSETAFTDSMVPNDCPCVIFVPTAGSST